MKLGNYIKHIISETTQGRIGLIQRLQHVQLQLDICHKKWIYIVFRYNKKSSMDIRKEGIWAHDHISSWLLIS